MVFASSIMFVVSYFASAISVDLLLACAWREATRLGGSALAGGAGPTEDDRRVSLARQ